MTASGERSGPSAVRMTTLDEASAAAVTPVVGVLDKLRGQSKLTVQERIGLLTDTGSFVEDGQLANALAAGLPADGVVAGRGTVDGRPVVAVANDAMAKAGSWGARTVEKIVRATEAGWWSTSLWCGWWTRRERGSPIRRSCSQGGSGSDPLQPGAAVRTGAAGVLPVRSVGRGPAFGADATIALPAPLRAVVGPEAAVNAVFANRISAIEDPEERAAFVAEQRRIYVQDVDLLRLASELVVDAVIPAEQLRGELVRRIGHARGKDRSFARRRHGVPPV